MEVSKHELDASHLGAKSEAPIECHRFNSSFHHFRFLIVMMSSFGIGLMIMMRLGMAISIQSMVNQTHLYLETHKNRNATIEDFLAEGYKPVGFFNWNNEIVSIILSWYMIAYTIPQVFCTQLSLKIGFHRAISISLFICALSLLLTPMAAHLGWQYVVAMRLLNGLGASPLVPLQLRVIETWVRPEEASLALTLGLSVSASLIFSNPILTGYLSAIHWVYAFYVPALCAMAFSVLWFFLATDRPERSRLISQRELDHLMRASIESKQVGQQDRETNFLRKRDSYQLNEVAVVSKEPVSWVQIFKVPSFYAFTITWTIYCGANHAYLFAVPTYLGQFLKIGVADIGLYGTMITAGCFAPVIWPHLLHKTLLRVGLSVSGSRRVQQTVCCMGVALTWIYVGLKHDHQILAFFLNGCFLTANDVLFPAAVMANYGPAGLSSIAFSIINSISDILIVPTCTTIGWFLDYTGQSRACWSWLFIGLGLSHVVLWLIFSLFTDSEPIEFGNERKKDTDSSERAKKLAALA